MRQTVYQRFKRCLGIKVNTFHVRLAFGTAISSVVENKEVIARLDEPQIASHGC